MQPYRLAAALLALGAAAAATPADAAKKRPVKKACFLITDDEGDGHTSGVLSSPVLDVLSADISTGRNEVTGIVRLKSTKVDGDPVAALGVRWSLVFTVRGVKYVFNASYTGLSQGPTPKWSGSMTTGGTGEKSNPAATFRVSGNNLLWTVSRKAVDGLRKPATYLFVENANSGVFTFGADGASAKPDTKYLDKAPSCLSSK